MDMLVNKPEQGFGMRSWRYAMIVDNRKVEKMFIEPGKNHLSNDNDPYVESTPEKILDYLNEFQQQINYLLAEAVYYYMKYEFLNFYYFSKKEQLIILNL
jgi:hypothetical protein